MEWFWWKQGSQGHSGESYTKTFDSLLKSQSKNCLHRLLIPEVATHLIISDFEQNAIKMERISKFEHGVPRSLYSLNADDLSSLHQCYLIFFSLYNLVIRLVCYLKSYARITRWVLEAFFFLPPHSLWYLDLPLLSVYYLWYHYW